MQRTGIEWTDFSSNPLKYSVPGTARLVNLCRAASPGCASCYAAAITGRFWPKDGPEFRGYSQHMIEQAKPVLVEAELDKLRRCRPKGPFRGGERPLIFLGDMTDLFGPWLPGGILDPLFRVIDERPDLTFQFVTKHPDQVRRLWPKRFARVADQAPVPGCPGGLGEPLTTYQRTRYRPNCWLLTSVEDQQRADERIPHLLRCRDLCPVLGLSCEPLLGAVDLTAVNRSDGWLVDALAGVYSRHHDEGVDHPAALEEHGDGPHIDWAIVGGESGPNARPCDLSWIRGITAQCETAGVPAFVKQLGSRPVGQWFADSVNPPTIDFHAGEHGVEWKLRSSKGGDPTEWPADLRVREFPSVEVLA